MSWQVVKPLRPHPLSVGQARNFCTRRLTSVLDEDGGYSNVVDDAAVIASELVTNAVSAGSARIEMYLSLRDSTVRIEVSDDAHGTVTPAHPGPDAPKGRGLVVVAALSTDWGVVGDDGMKRVWAEIALPAQDPSGEAGGTHPSGHNP